MSLFFFVKLTLSQHINYSMIVKLPGILVVVKMFITLDTNRLSFCLFLEWMDFPVSWNVILDIVITTQKTFCICSKCFSRLP